MPSMRTYSPRVTHRLLQLLVTITFRYDDTKLIAIQHRHRRFEEFEVDLYVVRELPRPRILIYKPIHYVLFSREGHPDSTRFDYTGYFCPGYRCPHHYHQGEKQYPNVGGNSLQILSLPMVAMVLLHLSQRLGSGEGFDPRKSIWSLAKPKIGINE